MAAELANSKVKKLVLDRSQKMRISSGAVADAVKVTAFLLRRIGMEAGSRARGHGRKTILENDIHEAAKHVCTLSDEAIHKALGRE